MFAEELSLSSQLSEYSEDAGTYFMSETMNPLPLSTIEENEDIIFGDSEALAIYSPLHSRTQSPVAIEGTPSPSAASSISSSSSSDIVPASNLTTNDSSTNANSSKDQEEGSKKDTVNNTMNNSEIVDEDNLLLEPISAFSGLSPVPKAKKRTRTSDTHPGLVSPTTNKDVKSTIDMSCNNNVRTNKDVAELLFERQRSILHKSSKPIRQAAAMEQSSAQPLPTMEQIDNHISQDYFMDGKELDRNVVIDYATNRSYVYTTDLGGAFQLPEFLFLDVPNSVYAARSCGQYITNKLVMDLLSIAAQGANVIQNHVLDDLVKNTNKSVYGVHNIFVPSNPDQGHENNTLSSMTDIPVQAISARFRLRFLQHGTQLHRMLCQNFMNGNKCHRGIMVFIPVMKENTPAEAFWGALEGIERIPEDDRDISNAKLDKWCIRIARQHGTYRGKDPEKMGVADRCKFGPYSHADRCGSSSMPTPRQPVTPVRTNKGSSKTTKDTIIKKATRTKMVRISRHKNRPPTRVENDAPVKGILKKDPKERSSSTPTSETIVNKEPDATPTTFPSEQIASEEMA